MAAGKACRILSGTAAPARQLDAPVYEMENPAVLEFPERWSLCLAA
jgi:hypothetical protein